MFLGSKVIISSPCTILVIGVIFLLFFLFVLGDTWRCLILFAGHGIFVLFFRFL